MTDNKPAQPMTAAGLQDIEVEPDPVYWRGFRDGEKHALASDAFTKRLARALHAGAKDGHTGARGYCLDCESDAERIAATMREEA